MRCPACNFGDSKVLDTRTTDEGSSIRRRRECTHCNKRFTTYEKIEDLPLLVVKKDGSRQAFDGQKILNGLIKASEKRPVNLQVLEDIVEGVEREIKNQMLKEVSSADIGELIMEQLKDVDEVAYVRFASVYREFKDINTFIREIDHLLRKK